MLNTIRHIIYLFSLLFLLLLTNICFAEPVGHKLCTDCHLTSKPASDGSDLIHPAIELCIGCHEKGTRNDHAIDVAPGIYGTNGLPLISGKIACITCHNVHVETRMLLRISAKKLCSACHPNL